MEFEWIIEKNFIFGYKKNSLTNTNSIIKKVYMFDLDYTIIKTKSGKKFPINKNDWMLLYPDVKTKIQSLTNSLVGIVSNQKGLKTEEQKKNWIEKLNQILKILKINFVFASIIDDWYRKPLPGSYEYIKDHYKEVDWDSLSTNNKIYYIGDAFGREKDFSDTDIKYAQNNGFKFKTPEIFFEFNKNDKESGSIKYPEINYFTEKEQQNIFAKLDKLISTHKKIFIVMIGLPACGKSFLRKELIKKYSQFVYSNNDDIHNNVQSKMLIKKISTDYDFIIDDNTNFDKLVRDEKLKQFSDYYKIGIWFDYELEVFWHLNWMRMYWFGGKLLPKVTYYTLIKKNDLTSITDGFDKFIKINKVFLEMNLNNKIKYYF
jgi:DNA 3'-phosphatase